MSKFISVATVESLPSGQGRTVEVKGRRFAVYNLDGQFYAIDDTCPHRGGPLGAGTLEDGRVFCPLHGWSFDLKTGACHSNPEMPVNSYPTRIENGAVQILTESLNSQLTTNLSQTML
jgi:nitrite reductase (NADH) small subunit/3-phenylpropionate/trans-cinnamate dioxygenase ferredoxin subunit